MEYVLRTHDLTKTYKNINAVDKLNMNIKKGEIYGFLGQNGAGKTTTLRMVMNLIKPSYGEIELFQNKTMNKNYKFFDRIGSIIEYPGLYLNLTAEENLEIHRRMIGMQGKESIKEVLSLVGLKDVGNKTVKNFSLGMKQRLGIGRALLHNPEFLILDEPTNGLDPMGIKEVRELILHLRDKRELTVLVSSHILSEVQQLASKIGIIHKGALLEEIEYESIQKKNRHYLNIKVNDSKKAAFMLENKLKIEDYEIWEEDAIRVYERLSESSAINRTLVSNNIEVKELAMTADSLEDYFVRLIGGR